MLLVPRQRGQLPATGTRSPGPRPNLSGQHVLLDTRRVCPVEDGVLHANRIRNRRHANRIRNRVQGAGLQTCSTRTRARASSSSRISRRLCWASWSRADDAAERSCMAASRMRVIC